MNLNSVVDLNAMAHMFICTENIDHHITIRYENDKTLCFVACKI